VSLALRLAGFRAELSQKIILRRKKAISELE